MCVCGGGGGGGRGDCNQGHYFYKLKHRSFKQLLLFLFTNGFKLTLPEVSLKLFRTISNLQSIKPTYVKGTNLLDQGVRLELVQPIYRHSFTSKTHTKPRFPLR